MEKVCTCGRKMQIQLRTLVYQNQVEIENVPVFFCPHCERNLVVEEVKPELKHLLKELNKRPGYRQVAFNEFSAFTQFLMEASATADLEQPVTRESWTTQTRDEWAGSVKDAKHATSASVGETSPQEKFDALLDMYILASSLNQKAWMEELEEKMRKMMR